MVLIFFFVSQYVHIVYIFLSLIFVIFGLGCEVGTICHSFVFAILQRCIPIPHEVLRLGFRLSLAFSLFRCTSSE
jgi:hypothetical protein